MAPYSPLPSNEEEDYTLLHEGEKKSTRARSQQSSSASRVWTILMVLLLLNVLVASVNAYYSVKTSRVLQQYTKKDPSELPRPDPFVGLKPEEKKPGATNLNGY